jgi:hypothetical protein
MRYSIVKKKSWGCCQSTSCGREEDNDAMVIDDDGESDSALMRDAKSVLTNRSH